MKEERKEKKEWLTPKLIVLTRATVVEQVLASNLGASCGETLTYQPQPGGCN